MTAYSCDASTRFVDIRQPSTLPTPLRAKMAISRDIRREMLTAEQVHDMAGMPISTLHDWAAKREGGIDAPGPHHIRLSNCHPLDRERRRTVDRIRPNLTCTAFAIKLLADAGIRR